jgi:hypothetical protein
MYRHDIARVIAAALCTGLFGLPLWGAEPKVSPDLQNAAKNGGQPLGVVVQFRTLQRPRCTQRWKLAAASSDVHST